MKRADIKIHGRYEVNLGTKHTLSQWTAGRVLGFEMCGRRKCILVRVSGRELLIGDARLLRVVQDMWGDGASETYRCG